MFGDRQKLDVGEAHFDQIREKPLDREIPQRVRPACGHQASAKSRDELHRSRSAQRAPAACPALTSIPGHARSGRRAAARWRQYSAEFRFAGPADQLSGKVHPVWTNDVVLIARARCDARHETAPKCRRRWRTRIGMPATVPGIEIADDRDPCRIRRPYRKTERHSRHRSSAVARRT